MQEPFVPLSNTPSEDESIGIDPEKLEIPSDFGTLNPFVLGLILDLSLRHHSDSRRYVDIAKGDLIKFLVTLQADDRVFFYDPRHPEAPSYKGQAVGRIGNYHTTHKFNPLHALRDTLEAVGTEDADSRKVIVYITDRPALKYDYSAELVLKRNHMNRYNCELFIFAIGNKCSDTLPQFKARLHRPEIDKLGETLKEILKEKDE
jgi:hypothetical protein